jgi:nucleotide-binding universal stress UspA family protein
MKQFKKILFINDFHKEKTPALKRAVKLARNNKALLTIIEVLEEFPPEVKSAVSPSSLMEYQRAVETESTKGLKSLILPLKKEGLQVSGEVLWGTPFIEIIREVIRNEHDLVMLVPRKQGKIKTMLFGSRIMHLMRKCPCPVWAIKPTEQKPHNKILAAVDPSPVDEEADSLNFKIMEMATSLAYAEQCELHIVSCRRSFTAGSLGYRVGLSDDDLEGINTEAENTARQCLDAHLEKFDLLDSLLGESEVDVDELPCRVHLLNGEPDDLIPELSNREQVDLVVMGTISRTGIPGLFIGNTAEKILQKLNCSVLAVKPDGFKTPVKLEI